MTTDRWWTPTPSCPPAREWAGHWASQPWSWEHLPPERLEAAETIDVVRRTIDALAPLAREVIVPRDVEGWAPAEVSCLLEITDGNQRVVLHRAGRGSGAPSRRTSPRRRHHERRRHRCNR